MNRILIALFAGLLVTSCRSDISRIEAIKRDARPIIDAIEKERSGESYPIELSPEMAKRLQRVYQPSLYTRSSDGKSYMLEFGLYQKDHFEVAYTSEKREWHIDR